jgi:hypothetical protein
MTTNFIPIIIPYRSNNETKLECIVQNGKTYCEKKILTPEEQKIHDKQHALGILGIIVYIGVMCWLTIKVLDHDLSGWLLGLWAALPFLIQAFYLIL